MTAEMLSWHWIYPRLGEKNLVGVIQDCVHFTCSDLSDSRFFAGCSGDLLVVAHFQCRLRPVGHDARSPFYRGDV